MSAIGILGGMGPQASTRLYEMIIDGSKAYTPAAVDEDYPEIVLLNVPVPNFISNKDKLPEARQMLLQRTLLLEQAGCTINGIACNTVHILLPELQAVTKVPFLSIPKLVAERVKASGFERIGLLATPTTLSSTLYDDALSGIAAVFRPSTDVAEQTENYIYKQLNDSLKKSEKQDFRRIVDAFLKEQKLDAVILGCTELPLVYGSSDNPKIIDTLQILCDGLLEEYFQN